MSDPTCIYVFDAGHEPLSIVSFSFILGVLSALFFICFSFFYFCVFLTMRMISGKLLAGAHKGK